MSTKVDREVDRETPVPPASLPPGRAAVGSGATPLLSSPRSQPSPSQGGGTLAARLPSPLPTIRAATIPTIVLGGSGYVAGELLRLLAGHPVLRLAAALSESQAGQPVEAAFPHLAGSYPGVAFAGREELAGRLERIAEDVAESTKASRTAEAAATARASDTAELRTRSAILPDRRLAVLSAAPHGAAAPLVDSVLAAAERAGLEALVVDLSADFRFATAAAYEAVYGHPHGAPGRLPEFRCALPEHVGIGDGIPRHVAHPGCFTTAVLLAAVPLLALGLAEPRLQAVATTGSTGAGRTPTPTTHHPARRSTLFAYNPLAHRHEPEMRALATAAAGVTAEISFVPQAGPFARGIYATVLARPARRTPAADAAEVAAALADFYAGAPFVDVLPEPPRLQDVVGTNRCRLGVAASGDTLVAFAAIDNLVKGAAGGGIQWMNRLLGLPETTGLTQPGLGWL